MSLLPPPTIPLGEGVPGLVIIPTTPEDTERSVGMRLIVLPLESIKGVEASESTNRLRRKLSRPRWLNCPCRL